MTSADGRSARRLWSCLIGLVVAVTCARGLAGAVDGDLGEAGEARLTTASGFQIAATELRPTGRKPLPGAVVLCHGISASRRHMLPLARSLVRRGRQVVLFDYGGHGRSQDRPGTEELNIEDVQAAIAFARRDGVRAVGLVGHSMGVTSAAAASLRDDGVVALVALGQRPFVSPSRPPYLLMADGAMDTFHPYGNLRAVLAEAAGEELQPLTTRVDPETKAVRRLFLSGACEHAGEVYDGAVLGEAVEFLDAALSGGVVSEAPFLWRPPLGASMRFVASAAAAAAMVVVGLLLIGTAGVGRRMTALVLALVVVGAQGLARYAGSEALGELVPAMLLGALTAGAVSRRLAAPDPPTGAWRRAAGVVGAVAAGWLGGTLMAAAPAFWNHPGLLLEAPLYLWQGIALRAQFTLDALATRLVFGNTWPTAVFLLGLLAVEVLAPGRLGGWASRLVTRLVDVLAGTGRDAALLETPPAEPEPAGAGRWQLVVLFALVGAAALLFTKRAGEGLLSGEGAVTTVVGVGLRLLLLPLAATTLFARGWRAYASRARK